jgi:hypothetical protein
MSTVKPTANRRRKKVEKKCQNCFPLLLDHRSAILAAMPRPPRPIADGLIYHVINRGNNRQPVFLGEGDYAAFLTAIADLKARKPFDLYGYCLMANHIHLLLCPRKGSISRIVHVLTRGSSGNFQVVCV